MANEVLPEFDKWEQDGIIDRGLFTKAGDLGLLGMAIPEDLGGGGVDDFRYNAIVNEELYGAGCNGVGLGVALHNDIVLPYFLAYCTEEQRERWLPGIASGELITAVAMTEPGIGSDLASMSTTAIRHGDAYVVNGTKTFITNGINADLVVTAVKTDPSLRAPGHQSRGAGARDGGVRTGSEPREAGAALAGHLRAVLRRRRGPGRATCSVREGQGFVHLVSNLPQERLSMAVSGDRLGPLCPRVDHRLLPSAHGVRPVDRVVPEQPVRPGRAGHRGRGGRGVRRCLHRGFLRGELPPERAAMAKWWCTELQQRVADRGLQLHGGYGYMSEFPIARAFADARVTSIYGGTTEIMKEIIGRSLDV